MKWIADFLFEFPILLFVGAVGIFLVVLGGIVHFAFCVIVAASGLADIYIVWKAKKNALTVSSKSHKKEKFTNE